MQDYVYSCTTKTSNCVELQFLTHALQWMWFPSLKIVVASSGDTFVRSFSAARFCNQILCVHCEPTVT